MAFTKRKQARVALKHNGVKHSLLHESMMDAYARVDMTGRIQEANHSFQTMLGYSEEELLLMTYRDMTPEKWHTFEEDILENQVLAKGYSDVYEKEYLRKDGIVFPVEIRTFLIRDHTGKPTGMWAIARDITKRKQTEEILEKRIASLTKPLDDAGDITFDELFTLADIQLLQNLFANACGVASLITYPDGTPMLQADNFNSLFSEIIRKNSKGIRNCHTSDAIIGRDNPVEPNIHFCQRTGLYYAGTSITVGRRNVANWLIGQVRSETQTEEQIMEYARELDEDETRFLEALRKLPVTSAERFEQIAHFLFVLANQISKTAYQNILQARFIAERKQIEKILLTSAEQFDILTSTTMDGFVVLDSKGHILEVNEAYRRMMGYSKDELMKMSALDVDAELKPENMLHLVKQTSLGPQRFETRHRCKDGRIIDIEFSMTAAPQQNRIFTFIRDITNRKQAEEELRDSEARYSAVVQHAKDGVFIIQDNVIKFANKSMADMLAYTPAELENTPYLNYVIPENRDMLTKPTPTFLLKGDADSQIYEIRLARKDGTIIDTEWSISIIQYRSKPAVVCIIRNITERKQIEAERNKFENQMREFQKLESLGVLAGGIAHDFNNLLMAILGNADLALLSLSPASPARQNIEGIVKTSQRAADLCNQMLAYSGKGRFVLGQYNLSEIVQEMAYMLQVSVSKKADLRYRLAKNLPPVEADATQLRQIIMNLITNASEALDDNNGIIEITSGVMTCDQNYLYESYLNDNLPEGRYVFLEVADSGCGMSPETRKKIFDPFFTTKFMGRGLGLSAVLGIIRGHRGTIKVYSEPGKGTTIKILFPAAEDASTDREQSKIKSTPLSGGGIVLLVDDDKSVLDITSKMLERLDFKVITASNGQEGLEVFRQRESEIDCVFLDLTMPRMDGEEVFREMRRIRNNVRVILSSGFNEQDVTQRFAGKGLTAFVQKPYTLAKLRDVMKDAFDKPE